MGIEISSCPNRIQKVQDQANRGYRIARSLQEIAWNNNYMSKKSKPEYKTHVQMRAGNEKLYIRYVESDGIPQTCSSLGDIRTDAEINEHQLHRKIGTGNNWKNRS